MTFTWRILSSLLLCASLSFGVAACGDDDGGGDGDGDGDGDTDAGPVDTDSGPVDTDSGPVDTDAGPVDTDAGPVDTDAGPVTGECTDELAAVQATYGDPPRDVSTIAGTCGQSCVFNGDPGACTTTCFNDATDSALSAECSACITGLVLCGINNCVGSCAADPQSAGCQACLCGGEGNTNGVDCVAAYATCSGLPPSIDCSAQ